MGCFSFYANKIITTGEGGMVTTNDDALAERLRLLRNLAFGQPRFLPPGRRLQLPHDRLPGGDGPRAAARRSSSIIEQKRRVARHLQRAARGRARASRRRSSSTGRATSTGCTRSRSTSEFPLTRDELMAALREAEIESRTFFCPMNMQPFLRRPARLSPRATARWRSGSGRRGSTFPARSRCPTSRSPRSSSRSGRSSPPEHRAQHLPRASTPATTT